MSSDVLGGLAFEANGQLQPRAPLSATQECCDQNAQMVRCPNVAAVTERYMRGNTRSQGGLSLIFDP